MLHRLGRQVAARPAVRRPVLLVATMAVAVAAGAVAILAAPARVGVPAGVACPAVDQGCRPLARPGGVVEVAAGRYRVGRPGDVVVIGRWACRGPLPALLDPAAGEIWVWDGWAGLGLPAPGRPVARVAGAASMLVVPGRLGCDRLRVTLRQGGAAVIDPSPRS